MPVYQAEQRLARLKHLRNEIDLEIRSIEKGLRLREKRARRITKRRPYCLRCEVPIYRDEDVWRREATGSQVCPRNPAVDGHEPRPDADYDAGWEAAIREFEGLADYWALTRGWIGPVALHDFRRKIEVMRARVTEPGGSDA